MAMRRRTYLACLTGSTVTVAPAGCLRAVDGRDGRGRPPSRVADPPGEVYVPTHAPPAEHVATARIGDYAVGLLVAPPVRFWTVAGERTERHRATADHDVHLMATAWDPGTGTVLPESGATVEVTRPGGDFLAEEVVYPMLGQRSGFHFGDNFALVGPGTYEVTVALAPLGPRATGPLRGRFEEGGSRTFDLELPAGRLRDLGYRSIDGAGSPGAVGLVEGEVPTGRAPPAADLPGRTVARTTVDGARYVATHLDRAPAGVPPRDGNGDGNGDDHGYLAVSVRTPHNRLTVPTAGLKLSLERNGRTVAAGRAERTVDPDLGYHYGLRVPDVRAGDRLTVAVEVPPQVARHEGYETAFLGTPEATVELSRGVGAVDRPESESKAHALLWRRERKRD